MGKNEFLSPKAIANRMKYRGLQKLQWYCQMCEKQCGDEHGFTNHCTGEGHRRQMQLFGQNPNRIIEAYSNEFESTFLDHMKRSHRFSRIAATVVYNELISDRHHIHMNSTKWATLTEFVKHLGKTGKCKVEETPKGWFITYIDRDFKEKLKKKRIKSNLAEEEKQEREIMKQIERAEQTLPAVPSSTSGAPSAIEVNLEDVKVGFSVAKTKEKGDTSILVFEGVENSITQRKRKADSDSGPRTALEELMREEERAKEQSNRKDYWLCEGIVVKVMSKALAVADKGRYYKQKGVVRKVIDRYVGEIELLDESKHVVVRVDQDELETVLPQCGGLVKIVNGAYRGCNARLLEININKFCAKVQIEKGVYEARVIQAIDYEDICKVF